MGNFSLKREGRNVENTIGPDGKLIRKTNAFGMAEAMKRKANAYKANVQGTDEEPAKMRAGMDKLAK